MQTTSIEEGSNGPPNSPDSSTVDQQEKEAIARQLEQAVLDDITATNERNFGPSSPLFLNKHPKWEADAPAVASRKLSLSEFVQGVEAMTTPRPWHQLRALDLTSSVDLRLGKAEVYANVEASGMWDGVAQRNVTLCEFRRVQGKWLHVAYRVINGFDMPRPSGGEDKL